MAQSNDKAQYKIIETGRSFGSLSAAVAAIGDGAGTIMIPPGTYRDCAVQQGGSIRYQAEIAGETIFDGATCEGKAALVLRGRNAEVDGIIFQNMKVPDANGAGIRLEQGNLTVTKSWFRNSQQGLLTADDAKGAIIIDQSSFERLGRCDGDYACAHSIYIGNYGSLTVTRSRFEAGNGGHYIKSRSARADIRDNAFDDSRGKTTNYMIDLPAGATGVVSGNIFVQGKDKENYSAFIAVAAEGKVNSSDALSIFDNDARIGPNIDRNSVFVADWSGDRISLGANILGPRLKPFERR
ncbi:right-handed parallel beta-helix repeat-containing protein [Sphingorhabdus lutea]|nr:right-handed parallel beta-helix repeat-containing protein [Sphingorhabdus lutea]